MEGGGNYKDYEYLITFTGMGFRCGYVALKENESEVFERERQKKKGYYPGLNCHGGITFHQNKSSIKDALGIICNDFWVGFDAGHCVDKQDLQKAKEIFGHKAANFSFPEYDELATHKTFEFMESHCHKIIDQLVKMNAS